MTIGFILNRQIEKQISFIQRSARVVLFPKYHQIVWQSLLIPDLLTITLGYYRIVVKFQILQNDLFGKCLIWERVELYTFLQPAPVVSRDSQLFASIYHQSIPILSHQSRVILFHKALINLIQMLKSWVSSLFFLAVWHLRLCFEILAFLHSASPTFQFLIILEINQKNF